MLHSFHAHEYRRGLTGWGKVAGYPTPVFDQSLDRARDLFSERVSGWPNWSGFFAAYLSLKKGRAEAMRAKEQLEVSDMETMRVRVEGFKHRNRQISIEHPAHTGKYMTADVRDPAFDKTPNVYTDAARELGWLKVQAKKRFGTGR